MSAEDAQNQYAARLGMENAGLIQKGNEAQDAASRFAAQLGLDTAGLGLKAGELQQGLGKDAYGLATSQAELLNKYGTLQQQEEQRRMDIKYQDFLNQNNFSKDQLQFYSNILRGQPAATSSTQTTSTPTGSAMTQVGGLGLAALGALR
jgi:hypothetical protein